MSSTWKWEITVDNGRRKGAARGETIAADSATAESILPGITNDVTRRLRITGGRATGFKAQRTS
ncbi:hypothetical protein ACWDHW_08390 [Streptomyces melanosporofaciens]